MNLKGNPAGYCGEEVIFVIKIIFTIFQQNIDIPHSCANLTAEPENQNPNQRLGADSQNKGPK